jgi:hypothetical protein
LGHVFAGTHVPLEDEVEVELEADELDEDVLEPDELDEELDEVDPSSPEELEVEVAGGSPPAPFIPPSGSTSPNRTLPCVPQLTAPSVNASATAYFTLPMVSSPCSGVNTRGTSAFTEL